LCSFTGSRGGVACLPRDVLGFLLRRPRGLRASRRWNARRSGACPDIVVPGSVAAAAAVVAAAAACAGLPSRFRAAPPLQRSAEPVSGGAGGGGERGGGGAARADGSLGGRLQRRGRLGASCAGSQGRGRTGAARQILGVHPHHFRSSIASCMLVGRITRSDASLSECGQHPSTQCVHTVGGHSCISIASCLLVVLTTRTGVSPVERE